MGAVCSSTTDNKKFGNEDNKSNQSSSATVLSNTNPGSIALEFKGEVVEAGK